MRIRTRWLAVILALLVALVVAVSSWSYVVARRTALTLAGPLPEGFVLADVRVVFWPLPPIEDRQLAWRFNYRRRDMTGGAVELFISPTGELLEKARRSASYVAPVWKERLQQAELGPRVLAAERVVSARLDHSLVTYPGVVPESLYTEQEGCDTYGDYATLALAAYDILGSELVGDTATVYTEVTSAAHLELVPNGYRLVQGVTVDTLSWRLLRTSRPQGWVVCGWPRPIIDFVRLEYFGGEREFWNGATYESVKALADSIHAAQVRRGSGSEGASEHTSDTGNVRRQ